jgi:hypothetical protein
MNHFSDVTAAEYVKQGMKPSILRTLVRPPWKFFESYVLRLGFLDGFPGLVIAATTAFYVFARYAKLWEAKLPKEPPGTDGDRVSR